MEGKNSLHEGSRVGTVFQLWMTLHVITWGLVWSSAGASQDSCIRCWCVEEQCGHACCNVFGTAPLSDLYLEVSCETPDSAYILDPGQDRDTFESTQCRGYNLITTRSQACLTAAPTNLCSFPDVRAVTLTWASLAKYPNVSCLSRLGLLDLSHNRITSVPRDAFLGLELISDIRLDHNLITHIHPNAFDVSLPNLNRFSVTHNLLVVIELWPLTMHHSFCYMDFSHNHIANISNRRRWTVDPSQTYGPGFVDASHNNISISPVEFMQEYGLMDPYLLWAKFLHWGFDLRHNPFYCDCSFYDVVVWVRRLMIVIQRDYFNITCAAPPRYSGIPVVDLPVHELTCDVVTDCPKDCLCLERPAEKDTLVNCSGRGLPRLPRVLPAGDLTLAFDNNQLQNLPARSFLKRTRAADFSNNRLHTVNSKVPKLLRRASRLDLRHNPLRHLPDTLQVMSSGAVLLDPVSLSCTCDLAWFSGWTLQPSSAYSSNHEHVACTTESGHTVLLANATAQDLGCGQTKPDTSPYKMFLATAAAAVVAVVVLLAVFRHESVVLLHVARGRLKRQGVCRDPPVTDKAASKHLYHVFVSSAPGSDSDVKWVTEELIPALQSHSLTCYWPPRDFLAGRVETEEVTKRLQDSASAVVVLSPDYVASTACLFQFTQAYGQMMAHGRGRLNILLLDAVSRKKVADPKLKAMLNLRMSVDASLVDDVLKDLRDELGTSTDVSGRAVENRV